MAAKRGRTITSFGQFFGTISGGQVVEAPVEPPDIPSVRIVGGRVKRRSSYMRWFLSQFRQEEEVFHTMTLEEQQEIQNRIEQEIEEEDFELFLNF